MKKLSIPKTIRIVRPSKKDKTVLTTGGITSKLDTTYRKNAIAERIIGGKYNTRGQTRLAKKALLQLCSKEYDNIKGYKPTIGKGYISDLSQNFAWWFTAPDGATKLPLAETALSRLIKTTAIKKGKVQSDIIVCKAGKIYEPYAKDDQSIQTALESTKSATATKPRDMLEGTRVIYRGENFIYLGMYSIASNGGCHRKHVIYNSKEDLAVAKPHFGGELMMHKDPEATYVPKDWSEELTKRTKSQANYHWNRYELYAKNNKALAALVSSIQIEDSKVATVSRHFYHELAYYKGKPYLLESNWNSDDYELYKPKLSVTGSLDTVGHKPEEVVHRPLSISGGMYSHAKPITSSLFTQALLYVIMNNNKVYLTYGN